MFMLIRSCSAPAYMRNQPQGARALTLLCGEQRDSSPAKHSVAPRTVRMTITQM